MSKKCKKTQIHPKKITQSFNGCFLNMKKQPLTSSDNLSKHSDSLIPNVKQGLFDDVINIVQIDLSLKLGRWEKIPHIFLCSFPISQNQKPLAQPFKSFPFFLCTYVVIMAT
uniref:Uncharacterized protein n=1 Tax=Cacopsylla melanoneura TaxID=428564 RepID=A0A8D8YWE6_9HEMI